MLILLAGCGKPLQLPTTPLPVAPLSSVPALTGTLVPTSDGSLTEPSIPIPGVVETRDMPPTNEATEQSPTAEPLPFPSQPTATLAVIIVPYTPVPTTNEQRWRTQEQDRYVLEPAQTYIATNLVPLLWYDPRTGQSLEIGTIIGEFSAQARFVLRSTQQPALEVSYAINQDYGLTAISDAVRDRMQAAGYTQQAEAYVLITDTIQIK